MTKTYAIYTDGANSMKRAITVAVLALIIPAYSWCQAAAKGKKVKVYMDASDMALNESFGMYVRTWMRMKDEEDQTYEFHWVEKATDADFIITVLMEKTKPSCICKLRDGSFSPQYFGVTQVWKKNSDRIFEVISVELNCDPNKIAEITVEKLEIAMGVKPKR